jgi:transposase InsO family protein
MSLRHPRYGYRRITALLRRDGFEINPKHVARIRREEGLKVSKRQKRTRRVGVSTAERLKAERARHVWSWDFVEDQTAYGSRFRILTLIDEYTRECLATHAAWSIRAVDAITVVEAAIERYGAPEHIRSDNGALSSSPMPSKIGSRIRESRPSTSRRVPHGNGATAT